MSQQQNQTALVKVDRYQNMTEAELSKKPAAELAALVRAVMDQKVASLGDGTVFVRKDGNGEVRAVQGTMKLSEAKGEVYSIPAGKDKPRKYSVTASGYFALNRIAGLSILTPAAVDVPGVGKVPNPYIVRERDAVSGREWTVGVWVKKAAVGYSPIGNLVVTVQTLYLDLHTYFIQDLLGKLKWKPECGKVMLETAVDDDMRKTHLILPYQYGLVVAADISKSDVLTILDTHIQRQRFAERVATTIAERNALKKHPAMAVTQVLPDQHGNAAVPVFGWRHDLTASDIHRAAEVAESDDPTSGIEVHHSSDEVGNNYDDAIDAQATVENEREKNQMQSAPTATPEQNEEAAAAEPLFPDTANTVKKMYAHLLGEYPENAVRAMIEEQIGSDADFNKLSPSQKTAILEKVALILRSIPNN